MFLQEENDLWIQICAEGIEILTTDVLLSF